MFPARAPLPLGEGLPKGSLALEELKHLQGHKKYLKITPQNRNNPPCYGKMQVPIAALCSPQVLPYWCQSEPGAWGEWKGETQLLCAMQPMAGASSQLQGAGWAAPHKRFDALPKRSRGAEPVHLGNAGTQGWSPDWVSMQHPMPFRTLG